MPVIERITLHPIKALDGVRVTQAKVLPSGALEYDREYAMADWQGNFVNGKRNAKVHLLRSEFDLGAQTITLRVQGTDRQQSFRLDDGGPELAEWLSDFFGSPVKLLRNELTGFPDDTDATGPTVVGSGTLAEVSTWFPGLSPEETLRRFRTNIVIGEVPAFWEDRLFSEPGTVVEFAAGEVRFQGVNPCERCVVPTRDPVTAEGYTGFQKAFAAKREETLPAWAAASRFDHYYRFSVNTKASASEAGKVIKVGDEVQVLGVRRAE